MNIRPLIIRELRAEARRAGNYWARTITAGLLTAVFVWTVWSFSGDPNSLGPLLFRYLTGGLFFSILIIVSALTGDSISRERREGTLGLLFLTPLNAREIVIGKTLLHALRAFIIFFAVLPVVSLPFLLGGIPLIDAVGTIAWSLAALLIAVASGILSSVRTTEWVQSIVRAELICAALLLPLLFGMIYLPMLIGLGVNFGILIIYPVAVLLWAVRSAGHKLQSTWQQDLAETGDPLWVRFFSKSGFWRAAFRWDTRRARDRNPIAWLQEYNWTSRLTKWGWAVILVGGELSALLNPGIFMRFRSYANFQIQLYILTALGIAFSAAASFRRERQTGALELLLVTPISAPKLIWGRLQGVWFHFFPAIAILTCVWAMAPQPITLPPQYLLYLAGAYFGIPVIGFYCSLLTSNVLLAWLLTLTISLLIPYGITQQFYYDIGRRNIPVAFVIVQCSLAFGAAILLYDNLTRRRFALQTF